MRSIEINENIIMLILGLILINFNIIGFIVSYFIWKEMSKNSEYIYINGMNLLNFNLSYFIYSLIAGIFCIVIVGGLILPILALIYFIFSIVGLFKYGTSQYYDYPLTIKFIK